MEGATNADANHHLCRAPHRRPKRQSPSFGTDITTLAIDLSGRRYQRLRSQLRKTRVRTTAYSSASSISQRKHSSTSRISRKPDSCLVWPIGACRRSSRPFGSAHVPSPQYQGSPQLAIVSATRSLPFHSTKHRKRLLPTGLLRLSVCANALQ